VFFDDVGWVHGFVSGISCHLLIIAGSHLVSSQAAATEQAQRRSAAGGLLVAMPPILSASDRSSWDADMVWGGFMRIESRLRVLGLL